MSQEPATQILRGTSDQAVVTQNVSSTIGPSLRDVIVDAGLEVLHRDGFQLQEETITYANVFRFLQEEYDVTVTRGSVHERIWASQDDFRFDVLQELVCSSRLRETKVLEVADEVLSELPAGLTARERIVEFTRRCGRQLLDGFVEETSSRNFVGWHSILATRDDREQVALRRLNNERSKVGLIAWQAVSADFLSRFDLQPRRALGLDLDQSAALACISIGTALSGFCIDDPAGSDLLGGKITLNPDANESAEWTLFGVLAMAVIDLLFEPVDNGSEQDSIAGVGFSADSLAFVDQPIEPVAPVEPADSRTSRRDRNALRQLVISAAAQMTRRDGFGLMPKSVTYKAAFDVVTERHGFVVNRSSVHKRIWPSHDAFRLEILARAASRTPPGDFDDLIAECRRTPQPKNPDGSVDQRQRVLDNIRAACQAHSRHHQTKREHLTWFALKAALTGQACGSSLGADQLKTIFSGAQWEMNQRWIDHFDKPLKRLGLKAKPELGLGWDRSIYLTAMLVTTCSLAIDFEVLGGIEAASQTYALPRTDGTNATDEWSVKALGQRAIIEFFFDLPE